MGRARVWVVALVASAAGSCAAPARPGPAHPGPVPTVPALEACEPAPAPAAAITDGPPGVPLSCFGTGRPVRLDGLRGRPTVVNVWASWCVPCRREMPLLQRTHERLGTTVRFLGVNTADDPGSAADFLRVLGIRFPQAVDDTGRLASRLGSPGLPVTIVIDGSGRVVYRRIGELHEADLATGLSTAGTAPP